MASDSYQAQLSAELDLSKINQQIADLNNTKITLQVEVEQNAAKRLAESIQRGFKQTKVQFPDMATQLADSFNIKNPKVIAKIRSQVDQVASEMAKAFDGSRINGANLGAGFDQAFNGLSETLAKNSTTFKSQMSQFYKSFYDDYKNMKVYISDAMKDAMGSQYDDIAKSGRIVRDAAKGVNLNEVWDEMSAAHPDILSSQLDNDVDQVFAFVDAMKAAKNELKNALSFDDLDINLQNEVFSDATTSVASIANQLKSKLEQNIGSAAEQLKSEFLLDITVNQDKLMSDIRQAIQQSAGAADNPIDISIEINNDELRNKIQSAISGISAENIPIQIDENEIRNNIHNAIQSLPLEEILVTIDDAQLRAEIQRVVGNVDADINLNIDRSQIGSELRAALSGVDFPIDFRIDEDELRNQIRQAIAGLNDLEVDVNVNIINLQNSLRQGIQTLPAQDFDFMDRVNRSGREGQDVFSALGSTFRDAFSAYTMANLLERGVDEIANAGKEVIQVVKDLNEATTDLMMSTGESRSAVQSMIKDYRDLGNDLGTVTLDVAQSADEWLRQGKTEEETTTLIKDSVVMSKVGQLDTSQATEYLTSAANGYKVAVDDVEGIIDRLASVDLAAAYDSAKLAEAMSKTATSANLAGISMDRLIAMIATVGETTQKSASTVGNSFQTIFSRMRDIKAGNLSRIGEDGTIEDLSNVEIVLKELGIQLRSSNGEFRNFQTVLDEVAASWNKFSTVQQAAIVRQLGGTRQSENLIAMFENYNKVLKYTEISEQSYGMAQQKFQDAYMSSLEAKTNQLKNSLEELAADTITDEMYAGFLDVASAAADVAKETDLIETAFAGLASGGATYALTHLIRLLRNTATEITALGGGLTGFTQLLMQHPAALVAAGVTAVVGAVNMYQANIEKMVNSAKEAGNAWDEQNGSIEANKEKIIELREALDSGKLTEEEAYQAKSDLLDIQSQLTTSYGDQAQGIDLVNGSLETQLDLLDDLSRKEAQQYLNENAKGNKIIKDEMEKTRKYGLGTFQNNDNEEEVTAIRKAISDVEAEYGDFIDFVEDENGAYVDITLNADASTSRDVLNALMTDLTAIEEKFGSSLLIKDMIKNISSALSDAKGVVEEYAADYEKIISAEMIADEKMYTIQTPDGRTISKSAVGWLNEYTEAIENYNEAIASGDPSQILSAKAAFDDVKSSVDKILLLPSMKKYTEQFAEVGDQLNQASIAAYDFKAALSNDGSDNYIQTIIKTLKSNNMSDVDFKDALLTDGIQTGEDAAWSMLYAAQDFGIISDAANATTDDINNLANYLVEAGALTSSVADDMAGVGEDMEAAFDGAVNSSNDLLSQIGTVNSALSSQGTGQSLDYDAFTDEGMADYQSALEYVNGTMQLNAEKVRELAKAKVEEQIATNDATKAQKQSDYLKNASEIETLRKKIEDNNYATGESADSIQAQIDGLLQSNDAIVKQCGQLDLLNASLRESIGAYQAWKDAQNTSESGDMFDDTLTALETIDDVTKNTDSDLYGRVGREDYQASLDLVIPETVNKEDTDAVNNYLDSIYSMFTHDEDGKRSGLNIEEFCQQSIDKGLMVLDEGSGEYQIAGKKTMEDFARGLNLSLPLVQAMFGEMEEFGGEFDWADEAVQTIGDLGVTANEAAENLRGISGNESLKINLDVSDIETKEGKLAALDETIQEMDGYKATLSVDSKEYEQANSIIQYCIAQKQQLTAPAVMSVDTSLVEGKIGEAVSLLQQFQTAQNELEMQGSVGMDTTEAQANVDALAQQIQGLDPNVTATLGIDTSSIDTITSSLDGLTPELLVKAGIDETAIIGYNPADKSATVKYDKDSSEPDNYDPDDKSATVKYGVDHTIVDAYNPSNLVRKVIYNVVTNGSAPSGGSMSVNGTANINGTANNSLSRLHSYGRAMASGDWGTKKNGTTLVGELGREIVVDPCTGKWHTVGDNGAEFVDIPQNAIVFNHIQTEDLLEHGYVAARGTALANGTAGFSGAAMVTGGIKASQAKKSTVNDYSSSAKAAQQAAKKAEKATKKTTKALESILESLQKLFDWIEVKLNRIQAKIDMNTAQADNAVGYKNKNAKLTSAQTNTKALIAANEEGAKRYQKQADSSAKKVGLSNNLYKKIKDGTIDIQSLSEENKKRVDEVKQWYDKMLDCQQAAEELKKSQRELAEQKFDNIVTEYDNLLDHIEHQANMLNFYMDQAEAKGYVQSTKYYNALIANEQNQIAKMNEERNALVASLQDSMNSGIIQKNSEEWYNMQSQINEVSEAILEANGNIIEFQNNIRQIAWDKFDSGQEAISRLINEADFLIDLLSNDKLYEDNGKITDAGMATLALHGTDYNVYMEQANEYAAEIKRINAEIAKDPYNTTIRKRREELIDLQQKSIQAADDEKETIKNLVSDGISKELDALQELIDKYTDALQSKKDLYDYQRDVRDKSSEISSLQKRLAAYQNDTSEEGQLKLQQTQKKLKDAQEDLRQTEYDKFVEDQRDTLDALFSEYSDVLNARLDDIDQLVSTVITSANENREIIAATIEEQAQSVGYTMTDGLNLVWGDNGSATTVLSTFSADFSDKATKLQSTIDLILAGVDRLYAGADAKATSDVTSATTNNAANPQVNQVTTAASSGITGSTTVKTPAAAEKLGPVSGIPGTLKKGAKNANVAELQKALNKLGYRDQNGKKLLVDKYFGPKTQYALKRFQKAMKISQSGALDAKTKEAFKKKGYAKGTDWVDEDELALTQEKGMELIAFPDGSMLTPLQRGSGVINNPNTEKVLSLAANHDAIMDAVEFTNKMIAPEQARKVMEEERKIMSSAVNNYGGQTVNVILDKVTFDLPNVQNPEDFMNYLTKSRKAQNTICDITLAKLSEKSDSHAQKSSLYARKNKF